MNARIQNFIKIALSSLVLSLPIKVNAQEIATCKEPEGYSYFHHSSIVPKDKSGWSSNNISGGITTLTKNQNGQYDILILDATKTIKSYVQDGGKVLLLRKGEKDATFLHVYPGNIIEIYTFWTTSDGKNKFDMLQSKGGDDMLIHQSGVMVGECGNIRFELIK
jgi:hypothetical protein